MIYGVCNSQGYKVLCTSPHLDNVDPPHLHISTMWRFHTYTFDNLTYTLSSINSIFSQSLKLIVAWYIRYDSFQKDYPPLYTVNFPHLHI